MYPLNLDQWKFYILSTNRLNNIVGKQKTIILASLLKLSPLVASFAQLQGCVEAAAKEGSPGGPGAEIPDAPP